MADHFANVGFGPPSELTDLADRAVHEGEWFEVPAGFYVRWAPGAGAELWVQLDRERALLGLDPYFDGAGQWRLAITGFNPDARIALGGQLVGMAGAGRDPESGLFPLAIDVPDSHLLQRRVRASGTVTLHLAAFGERIACFADEASFTASFGSEPVWAPESFVPTGLFLADGLPNQPAARATFAGHILAAERRVNPATQRPFHVMNVQTCGGVCDVVAEPGIVTGQPVTGGIVHGDFWLTGRLAP